jgi:hypothetical protein
MPSMSNQHLQWILWYCLLILIISLFSKAFDFELSPISKGERLETLNVALILYLHGSSNLYALFLIHSRTLNE